LLSRAAENSVVDEIVVVVVPFHRVGRRRCDSFVVVVVCWKKPPSMEPGMGIVLLLLLSLKAT
jgi:hypothetical protein